MKKIQEKLSNIASTMALALVMVLGFAFGGAVVTPAHAADCNVSGSGRDLSINQGVDCAQGNDQPDSLFGDGGMFQVVTNVMLFLIGAVSVIMLIIGGIRYTISNGDQGAVTSAKNTIMYAIIGLVVAILAYAITGFVTSSFTDQ